LDFGCEIYRAVNRSDPRASRATVYNNLHALAQAGLVREVHLEGKSVRIDTNTVRIRRKDGENHYPRNVYPKDYERLEAQLRPLNSYAVELRDGGVWVDLE
jgi:ferric uptake regulator family protein